ncbi:MAG TPA: DUF3999 family protein [Vicinamibacterales bacterium]|nr:DUF3999 family protein [Vicinamibacterales bacterium]
MTRARKALVMAALGLWSATALAQSPRFERERTAEVVVAGPQRLEIDAPLLAGSQPFTVTTSGQRSIASGGLNDLRLFNAQGVEVPYLLVAPSPGEPARVVGRILPITAIDLPNAKSSGFEVDFEGINTISAVDLSGIQGPFLKRFRLEGSGDRTRWTVLVAEGTAFNLPAEQLAHTLIEFVPGDYRYVRVTWDDTNSGRVAPPATVSARLSTRVSPGPVLREPITISERPSEPGRSRFRLSLPAARLPIVALELTVGGGHLSRDARVLESSLVGEQAQPRVIGSARLVRVVRDGINADALRIPIRQPREPQLDLVVDDGDNPPLALEGVTAVFAELPWIYFESPAGTITARYGDPRLTAPRYDLEAVRADVPANPQQASWRTAPPVTLTPETEGLPMPERGSRLEIDGFEYMRDIPAGPAALITVPLDAAVMAHSGISKRRLRDVRVVDGDHMQVPYLIEKRDEPLIVATVLERRDLPSEVPKPQGRVTTYAVRLPYPQLPEARLVLSTQSRVFRRPLSMASVVPAAERRPPRLVTHASVTWVHANPDTPAPALTLPLPEFVDGDLYVLLEEGDNQPLPIDKANILLPSYAIRMNRPANAPLRMLYGKDGVPTPSYDLQLLAPQVMGRVAEEVTPGAEQRFAATPRLSDIGAVSPIIFWLVLGLAVLVLLGMVVKLMRREEVASEAPPQ